MNDIKETPDKDNEHLCTKEEMAEKLRISQRHLQTMTKRRLIPVIMIGASVRYDWYAVKTALKKMTIEAR